jgi:glycine/D-amino acid oxidase-like deaminating enzyme
MAFTPDRLPLIGPADDGGRVWLAAGFNGHGLPFAALAGARVAAGLGGGAESRGEAWSVMDPRRWLPA